MSGSEHCVVFTCFNGEYRVLASSWPYIGQSDWHQAGVMVRRIAPAACDKDPRFQNLIPLYCSPIILCRTAHRQFLLSGGLSALAISRNFAPSPAQDCAALKEASKCLSSAGKSLRNPTASRDISQRAFFFRILLGVCCVSSAQTHDVQISNGIIQATIHPPDPVSGFYRGTRFDWSGVIGSLKYAGHNYYGPWFTKTDPTVKDYIYQGDDIVAGPCSAVTGPAEEFSTNEEGLGFSEAAPGGTFLKIGVGVSAQARQ